MKGTEQPPLGTERGNKEKSGKGWTAVTQADAPLAPLGKVGPRELEFRQARGQTLASDELNALQQVP